MGVGDSRRPFPDFPLPDPSISRSPSLSTRTGPPPRRFCIPPRPPPWAPEGPLLGPRGGAVERWIILSIRDTRFYLRRLVACAACDPKEFGGARWRPSRSFAEGCVIELDGGDGEYMRESRRPQVVCDLVGERKVFGGTSSE